MHGKWMVRFCPKTPYFSYLYRMLGIMTIMFHRLAGTGWMSTSSGMRICCDMAVVDCEPRSCNDLMGRPRRVSVRGVSRLNLANANSIYSHKYPGNKFYYDEIENPIRRMFSVLSICENSDIYIYVCYLVNDDTKTVETWSCQPASDVVGVNDWLSLVVNGQGVLFVKVLVERGVAVIRKRRPRVHLN